MNISCLYNNQGGTTAGARLIVVSDAFGDESLCISILGYHGWHHDAVSEFHLSYSGWFQKSSFHFRPILLI